MSHLVGKPSMWFPTRSDTNRPVQAQKRDRNLKFQIYVEGELYYPSSENKGADQLRSYCEADLRLCFRLGRLLVFPCGGSYDYILFFSIFQWLMKKKWKLSMGPDTADHFTPPSFIHDQSFIHPLRKHARVTYRFFYCRKK